MPYRPLDGGGWLTFAEVAFELADTRHPLCRLTKGTDRAHAIYRILDNGEASGRHRAHLLFQGPPESAAEILREARAARVETSLEPALTPNDATTSAILETPLDGSTPQGLAALPGVLASHGVFAIFDPLVAIGGRVRVRFVIPRQLDPQDVLRALQEIPRTCGFADFRIQRIGGIAPASHIESARRSLPPEQETLLALAAAMGYYQTPKVVTLEAIARAVGLSISPVHKRLKAAEEAIVSQHIAPAQPEAVKRRSRVGPVRIEPTTPWEMQLRVRGDIGPAAFVGQTAGARAALHVLSVDGSRAQSSVLVLVAPDDAQAKLLASLEDRPDVAQCSLVERTSQHVVCRLVTRDRGAWSLGWWTDAWGSDTALRTIVFQNGEAHIRAFLTKPHNSERFAQRLQDCAHTAGWSEWDVVALRSLASGAPPSTWPEPLTQRQLEVLRVAHALGYYQTPRGCTLENVATTLGVSANAIHKNLVLAESKLIAAYLAGGM